MIAADLGTLVTLLAAAIGAVAIVAVGIGARGDVVRRRPAPPDDPARSALDASLRGFARELASSDPTPTRARRRAHLLFLADEVFRAVLTRDLRHDAELADLYRRTAAALTALGEAEPPARSV